MDLAGLGFVAISCTGVVVVVVLGLGLVGLGFVAISCTGVVVVVVLGLGFVVFLGLSLRVILGLVF